MHHTTNPNKLAIIADCLRISAAGCAPLIDLMLKKGYAQMLVQILNRQISGRTQNVPDGLLSTAADCLTVAFQDKNCKNIVLECNGVTVLLDNIRAQLERNPPLSSKGILIIARLSFCLRLMAMGDARVKKLILAGNGPRMAIQILMRPDLSADAPLLLAAARLFKGITITCVIALLPKRIMFVSSSFVHVRRQQEGDRRSQRHRGHRAPPQRPQQHRRGEELRAGAQQPVQQDDKHRE